MQLTRLKVTELRRFRQAFELRDLQPGLNLFSGANEAGKSTLVRAIRAAFFERHRSTAVEDLRPTGDSAASPTIELDFTIDGTAYRLAKSFLQRKRCELVFGNQRLDGAAAEDHLATLLGFQFAAKGASRPEHWGIPGLLWIEQGAAQEVHEGVDHAGEHLRTALQGATDVATASGGNLLLARIRELRGELLTDKDGRPKGAYKQSLDEVGTLAAQITALVNDVNHYRDQVDQLRDLREAHDSDVRSQPWQALRVAQQQAEQSLTALAGRGRELAEQQQQLARTETLRTSLLAQLASHEQALVDGANRARALVEAQARHEQSSALAQQADRDAHGAATRAQAAHVRLNAVRRLHEAAAVRTHAHDARERLAQAEASLQRAETEARRLSALTQAAQALRLDPKALQTLREQHQRLRELEVRRDAQATRVTFDLRDDATVSLDGTPLQGQGSRHLIEPGSITIQGVGVLHITPGGDQVADLAHSLATLRHSLQLGLQRLGLSSLAEAEARAQQHRDQHADAVAAERALALLAPQGVEALRKERDTAQGRWAQASAALAALGEDDPSTAPGNGAGDPKAWTASTRNSDASASARDGDTTQSTTLITESSLPLTQAALPPLASAEADHEAARAAADAAGARLQLARQALAVAASTLAAAREEHTTQQTLLADPQRLQRLAGARAALLEAEARHATVQREIAASQAHIAQARPDILEQDVLRYRRSADEAERVHRERELGIVQLEAELAAAGARGLEEELASRQIAHAHAQRRLAQLQLRAEALDDLQRRLDARLQALTRRLQAPLQQRIDHYLPLLLPQAQLSVDEQLRPSMLVRNDPQGQRRDAFERLSFGAREQMGVVSRLAYADLLREASRPTLLILDDALVHTDEARLAQMKRMLFDAGQRHQVLVFTCHPARWRDLGVAARALAG